MNTRRGLLLLIWVAVTVLGAIIIWKERELSSSVEVSSGRPDKFLIPVPLDQIGAVEVLRKGQLHRFERDDAGTWFYHGQQDGPDAKTHAHKADPLAANTIAQAITMFSRTQREQPIPLQAGSDEFGVSRPDILIMVYSPGKSDPVTRLAVGIVSPDGYSRYVLPVGAAEAVTIAEYQITGLMATIDAVSKNPAPAMAPSAAPEGVTVRRQ